MAFSLPITVEISKGPNLVTNLAPNNPLDPIETDAKVP